MRQRRMSFQRAGPQPGAKAARVGVAQDLAITHHQVNVIVLFCGQLFTQNPQTSRHPKVDNNPAAGKLEQQIFGTPLHAQHRYVAQTIDFFTDRPAQTSVANNSMQNGRAHQEWFDATPAGFYLR